MTKAKLNSRTKTNIVPIKPPHYLKQIKSENELLANDYSHVARHHFITPAKPSLQETLIAQRKYGYEIGIENEQASKNKKYDELIDITR